MPRSADGACNGIKRKPPLNSTTVSLAPTCNYFRRRTSSGITTWNLGDTVTVVLTVCISISIAYDNQSVDLDPLRLNCRSIRALHHPSKRL